MISTAELRAQRRVTDMFIKADQLDIVLERSTRTSDGAGGVTSGVPTPLPAQVMRLIPRQDGATERTTADGQMVSPSYTLMGYHDADMQRWDEFTHDGHRYQVVFINENRQYETKGEVAYLG